MRKVFVSVVGLMALALAPAIGAAKNDTSSDPNLHPELAPEPRVIPEDAQSLLRGGGGGAAENLVWIAANQFTVPLYSTSPTLTYAGNHFYNSPGGAGARRYYAQLTVDPGRRISRLSCIYNDSDEADKVGFTWFRYVTDLATGTSASETIDSFETAGSPGLAAASLVPDTPVKMQVRRQGDLVNHHIAVDVSQATSFAGCYAFLRAPGPVTKLKRQLKKANKRAAKALKQVRKLKRQIR